MKCYSSRSWPIVLLIPLIVLGGRLAWIASRAETGRETIGGIVHDSLFGWFLGPRDVASRCPNEQADFWLAETERILASRPHTPELLMGAAWVLDFPGTAYLDWHLRSPDRLLTEAAPDFGAGRNYDPNAPDTEEFNTFEKKCRPESLRMAALATEQDSQDVRWWRMRAFLQFHAYVPADFRNPEWESVLDEAARHDPENALYDYMAAWSHWEASGHYWDGDRDEYGLIVHDPERFARGEARFERGAAKRILAIGERGRPVIAEFLRHSRMTRSGQAQVARDREMENRAANLLRVLDHWQRARAVAREQEGIPEEAAVLLRQTMRFRDQIKSGGEEWIGWNRAAFIGAEAGAQILELAQRHPGLLPDEVLREVEGATLKARVASHQSRSAFLAALRAGSSPSDEIRLATVAQSAARILPLRVAGLLALLGLLGLGIARLVTGSDGEPAWRMGSWRHVAAWIIGVGLSLLMLGVLLPSTRWWGLLGGKDWTGEIPTGLGESRWALWALLNWLSCWGHYVGPAAALLLVAVWFAVHSRPGGIETVVRGWSQARCGHLLACVGRSAVGLAYCWLLIVLAAAPGLVLVEEEDYQRKITAVRNPDEDPFRIAYRSTLAALRADAAEMEKLIAEIEAEMVRRQEQLLDKRSEDPVP